MKKLIALFFILLILPLAIASLKIEKQSSDETIIRELGEPTILKLKVTNLGNSGTFIFQNIPGFFVMESKNVELVKGEPKIVELKVYARENLDYDKFYYALQYQIFGQGDFSQ